MYNELWFEFIFTLSNYTWDVMLKITKIKLQLLTDIDTILFIENGICEGLSQCSHRYIKGNNLCMSKTNDSNEETSYILNINNLLYLLHS